MDDESELDSRVGSSPLCRQRSMVRAVTLRSGSCSYLTRGVSVPYRHAGHKAKHLSYLHVRRVCRPYASASAGRRARARSIDSLAVAALHAHTRGSPRAASPRPALLRRRQRRQGARARPSASAPELGRRRPGRAFSLARAVRTRQVRGRLGRHVARRHHRAAWARGDSGRPEERGLVGFRLAWSRRPDRVDGQAPGSGTRSYCTS